MPYREKTAWLSLVAMAVSFGPYFAIVAAGSLAGAAVPTLRQLGLLVAAALVQVLILGVGQLWLAAVRRGRSARAWMTAIGPSWAARSVPRTMC